MLLAAPSYAMAESVELFVSGILVTEENCGDVLGDGSVQYDFASGVLTMQNAVLTGNVLDRVKDGFSIQSDGELTLMLKGDNKIAVAGAPVRSGSIMCNGTLTIEAEAGATLSILNGWLIADRILWNGGHITIVDTAPTARVHSFIIQGELIVTGGEYEGTVQGSGAAYANWVGTNPVFPEGTMLFAGDTAPGTQIDMLESLSQNSSEFVTGRYLHFICPDAVPAVTPEPNAGTNTGTDIHA